MLSQNNFDKGITVLLNTFNNLTIPEKQQKNVFQAWYFLLKDMDAKQFEQNIMYICKNITSLYPGHNIVALIRNGDYQKLDNKISSLWWNMLQCLYKSKEFDFGEDTERVTKIVKLLGGRERFFQMTHKLEPFLKKEFERLYKNLVTQADIKNQLKEQSCKQIT